MRNTYIAAGNDDNDEIIATMGDGLYAKSHGRRLGQSRPRASSTSPSARAIWSRGGKIVHPVRGASLIGRGSEILTKIDRVGKDMQMAQGMCGSLSGSVPTNVGQPMIRVSSTSPWAAAKEEMQMEKNVFIEKLLKAALRRAA